MPLTGEVALVTGACGFIGSHLVERLVAEGCRVRAYVFYNSFGSWGWLDSLPADTLGRVEVVAGDIRDAARVRGAAEGAAVVFHLAALIGIPYSYEAAESYLETNVRGTLNVLQAARQAGCSRVLVTSTSEVYGTARRVPIDETHPRQAQSPYAATKIAADALAMSFHRSHGLPVTVVRPFNTYGPRQSARAFIPTVIAQLLDGARDIKLGSLHPTRDLLFVGDTVEGFLTLARCGEAVGEEVNIASGTEHSVGEVAQSLIGAINPSARIVADPARVRPAASEVERLVGDSAKLRRLTSWRPRHPLDEGLRETIAWFRRPDVRAACRPGQYHY